MHSRIFIAPPQARRKLAKPLPTRGKRHFERLASILDVRLVSWAVEARTCVAELCDHGARAGAPTTSSSASGGDLLVLRPFINYDDVFIVVATFEKRKGSKARR